MKFRTLSTISGVSASFEPTGVLLKFVISCIHNSRMPAGSLVR